MFVSQDGLREFTMAGWALAFLGSVRVCGKPRRVDTKFDELAWCDMAFDDLGRNLKQVAILGVPRHTVYQLVAVTELLLVKLPLKNFAHAVVYSIRAKRIVWQARLRLQPASRLHSGLRIACCNRPTRCGLTFYTDWTPQSALLSFHPEQLRVIGIAWEIYC